ncbi:MAG TPA: hypothetical protein VF597_04740 [Candidatus Saccharimonadales bacterium]|jgi:uncharacterized membrane protein YhaH (DUF805 family)
MKSFKTKKYYVPTSIQTVFVGTLGVLFALQFFFLGLASLAQTQNPNMDAFPQFFYAYELMPLALFVIAYALNPRKLRSLERSFESLVLAVCGVALWAVFMFVTPMVLNYGEGYGQTLFTSLYFTATVFALLYASLLLLLQRSGRWS